MLSERRFVQGRHAGVLVPLFSIPSAHSWGIGEIGDLPALAAWLRPAGFDCIQLLPINELPGGETSPYSAFTAMALDPMYLSLGRMADFQALGGEQAMGAADRARLARARRAARVPYATVRALKWPALRASFERFTTDAWHRDVARRAAFEQFAADEGWWLDDYTLYRALHARYRGRPWMEWPEALRARDARALRAARDELAREILFYGYLQWMAADQWQTVRGELDGIGLFGDVPFMVGKDSVDVWCRQDSFQLDVSVGAPPDAFSEEGQDWGLPAYRWDVMARDDYAWLRARVRRTAALYDGFRVDHVVGFYRTYCRFLDGSPPAFVPADEPAQLAMGERLMAIFCGADRLVIAEDLGSVPDFVRMSLVRLGVPGYRILRWEREWEEPDQPFRDPADYPARSLATTGTHDTEALATWWEQAPAGDRFLLAAIPSVPPGVIDPAMATLEPRLRDGLLDLLYRSGSDLLILPLQDLFGWRNQINVPGTSRRTNWIWRLPWPVDRLADQEAANERARTLRALAAGSGRLAPALRY